MAHRQYRKYERLARPGIGRMPAAVAFVMVAALALQGCFSPVYPQLDRDARVMEALDNASMRDLPPSPLTAPQAVAYALRHSLDAKVAEIEAALQNESLAAARRRLLPSLNVRYSPNYTNHPSARWSESTKTGSQSLESSYSSEQYTRQSEVGLVWNLIDFGVGYLRARQQGERILHSEQQRRRVRQQIVLDVLSQYWRTSAAVSIAAEAESLHAALEKQGESIRDSVELRILSGAEGARRELSVYGSLAELEQYRRLAAQSRLELARVMGCGGASELTLDDFSRAPVRLPDLSGDDPRVLQAAALKRRPELFQQDAQERVAVDEARLALLQMAPNANLSLSLYDDPDKYLEWSNWMTAGVRVTWNLFSIPARMSERRMAKLQKEAAKRKGLALAAAVMAQVGIAYSDWRLVSAYATTLERRAAARGRLVEALAAGEKDGQTRPGEVLQERVRLLSEKAAALRAEAEVRVAGARLANAIGLDVDDDGNLVWRLEERPEEKPGECADGDGVEVLRADLDAERAFPDAVSGLRVIKAEDFLAPDEVFDAPAEESGGGNSPEKKTEKKSPGGKASGASDNEPARPGAGAKNEPGPLSPKQLGKDASKTGASSKPGARREDSGKDGKGAASPEKKIDSDAVRPEKKAKTNQLHTMSPPEKGASSHAGVPKTVFADNFDTSLTDGGVPMRTYRIESQPVTRFPPGTVVHAPRPLERIGETAEPLPEPVPVRTAASTESVATSTAGILPFAFGKEDAESVRRGAEREKALEPLPAMTREKTTRPPPTEVRIPFLRPPGV